MPAFDVAAIRKDFPILARQINGKHLTYLDSASTSQKPQFVLDALNLYWTSENANIHRGVHHLSQVATAAYEKARSDTRALLGAAEDAEIIFTKGCTESINLVAHGLSLSQGDRILVTIMEHHSNIVPWQIAAQKAGAKVEPIPITPTGEVDLDAYRALLAKGRVKLVGLVHISNSLGTINPVKEMASLAHQNGALVLVDGAQAGPHRRIDVQELDVDFYTLSCHKIYAPTGVGVLYGKRALLEAMPVYQGGGDMIRIVSFERTTYAPIPSKFEAGTPNIAGVIGFGAAIQYLASIWKSPVSNEIDLEERLDLAFQSIERTEQQLADYAAPRLLEVPGLKLIGTAPEKAGVLSFVLDYAHPHDVGTILDAEGIAVRTGHHCCQPLMKYLGVGATTRASIGLYNTEEEIDILVRGLHKVRDIFG